MGNKPAYFKTKTAFEGGLNAVLFDWFRIILKLFLWLL